MADKLTEMEEVLFRQIHPNFLHDGEPASDRFRPSTADQNKLSIDRSSKTTPESAYNLYTSTGKLSAAVFGVTVGEFDIEAVQCIEDPIKEDPALPDNEAHALADYSSHPQGRQKIIAKRLKKVAIERGCLFQPVVSGNSQDGEDVSA